MVGKHHEEGGGKSRKGDMKAFAVFVSLLLFVSPFAMAQEMAGGATSADEADIEWGVVWQDDGNASVEQGDPEWVWFVVYAIYWAYTAYTTYEDIENGDYGSAVLNVVPGGKVPKWASKLWRMKVGIETEKKVLRALGEEKNTEKLSVDLNGETVRTIPDILNHEKKLVGEIKDYSGVVYKTKQIEAQITWAREHGYEYKLYTNDCSKLSKPLLDLLGEENCVLISTVLRE